MFRPKITTPHDGASRAPRAPSLRSLVKLAVKCQSADELGERLRKPALEEPGERVRA